MKDEELKQNLCNTITHVQLDDNGMVVSVKGRFKVSDLRDKVEVKEYYDEDIFKELNIRRMN